MSKLSLSSLLSRSRAAQLALGLALVVPGGLPAQNPPSKQPKTMSEKTGAAFQQLKPLAEAKNFTGMLAVLDGISGTVDPQSYDMALILDMKAKSYGQLEQFDKAITAWEEMIRLNDAYGYFEPKVILDDMLYLAQFSYQVGVNSKVPAVQQQYINKSSGYFKRWLASTPKPSAEILMFYASILYNQAVADPKKVDPVLLKQAQKEVENGLLGAVHPKEGLYVLLLAILQQQNDVPRSTELLEQLVAQYPAKKDYWPSLWASYLNQANDATVSDKDEGKAREFYIRAINTVERAQAAGTMKTPKDNFNLVNLYLTVGQFGKATDLLYAGLKSGAIDKDPKTWLTLGYYYQQANMEMKAIAVLKEASTIFPGNGQFYLQIGQVYQSLDKIKDASEAFKEGIRRGGLEKGKEANAYQALAYAAFELEEFDEALKAVEPAETFPEGKKDAQLPKLKAAIEAAIKEREYTKAEAAKKSQV